MRSAAEVQRTRHLASEVAGVLRRRLEVRVTPSLGDSLDSPAFSLRSRRRIRATRLDSAADLRPLVRGRSRTSGVVRGGCRAVRHADLSRLTLPESSCCVQRGSGAAWSVGLSTTACSRSGRFLRLGDEEPPSLVPHPYVRVSVEEGRPVPEEQPPRHVLVRHQAGGRPVPSRHHGLGRNLHISNSCLRWEWVRRCRLRGGGY
jgi:hypothetical protein